MTFIKNGIIINNIKFYSKKFNSKKNSKSIKNKQAGGEALKRKTLKYVFSVLLSVIVIICIFMYLYIHNKNASNQSNLLTLADNIISENIVNGQRNDDYSKIEEEKVLFSIEKISQDSNVLGKIKIPAIGVEAPIEEGTTADILKESVGHFSSTSYWNGNVALASHNRGTYAHYFANINNLNVNDEIIYQTKLGTRIYVVNKIEQISEEDLSVLNNSEENTITLITCIKNKSNLRLCVKAVEKT